MAASHNSGDAPARPDTTAPTTIPLSIVRDRLEALWQELWALPTEIGDDRHHAMLIMFDRMSAAVYSTAPLYKGPILEELRRFDAGRVAA